LLFRPSEEWWYGPCFLRLVSRVPCFATRGAPAPSPPAALPQIVLDHLQEDVHHGADGFRLPPRYQRTRFAAESTHWRTGSRRRDRACAPRSRPSAARCRTDSARAPCSATEQPLSARAICGAAVGRLAGACENTLCGDASVPKATTCSTSAISRCALAKIRRTDVSYGYAPTDSWGYPCDSRSALFGSGFVGLGSTSRARTKAGCFTFAPDQRLAPSR